MVKLTLPDGSVREMPSGTTGAALAAAIGPGLARAAVAIKVNGEVRDLGRPIEEDASVAILTDRDPDTIERYRPLVPMFERMHELFDILHSRRRKRGSIDFDLKEAEFVLKQLSNETGGRAFFPSSVAELSGIYQQISDELANQYSIGYSSRNPARNGAWRRIVVRTTKAGLQTRTRQGYFGPRSQ